MTTITTLINIAAATKTTRFAAQRGIFIDNMEQLVAMLTEAGHKMQQNDGKRVLVDHTAWVTAHGVIHPVRATY